MPRRPKDLIIHDGTPERDFMPTRQKATGLDLSARPQGFAYGGTAEPFPDNWVIPRSDWQAIIKEKEERDNTLSAVVDLAGLPCKDQEQTPYCWINAPTHACEVVRVEQNQEMVILSPASAGGPITNYRAVGGWGKTGLEYIVKSGLVPISRWPANAIDRRYNTPENRQVAMKYRVVEWFELEPNNIDHLVSALLRNMPVPVGYAWWGHEVTAYDAVWLDGAIAIRFRNSWGMSYGTKGYGILQGRKMLADDAIAPRTAIAA